ALVTEGTAAEAAATARGRHARGADELVDQVLIPLVRPDRPGALSRHGPQPRDPVRQKAPELVWACGDIPAGPVVRAGMRYRRSAGRFLRPFRARRPVTDLPGRQLAGHAAAGHGGADR